MKTLIALTGYRGCGKNFFYDNVFKNWEEDGLKFKPFAFADLLKEYCSKIYGFTLDEIEEYKRKDKVFKVGKLNLTMRQILVNTANSLREISNPTIWAELVIEKIMKEDDVIPVIPVITDLRFMRELELLKDEFKVLTIYIENNCKECQNNKNNKDEKEIEFIRNFATEFILDCQVSQGSSEIDFNEIKNKVKYFLI